MDAAEPNPRLRPLDFQQVRHAGQRGIVLIDRLGFAEPTFVPAGLLPIVGRCDGSRPIAAIAEEAAAQIGETVPEALVRDLLRQLEDRLVLDSPRFHAALQKDVAAFLAGGVRPCRHAGSAGYPAEPDGLREELTALVPDAEERRAAASALVAPHIDLTRGRAGYAAAYGRLLACEPADLYVVFGTGHQGPTAPFTGLELDWQTPLGSVRTDRSFVRAVHAEIGASQPLDVFLHRDEHSLEFQVLLLQHVAERRGGRAFEVACFQCGHLPSANGDPGEEAYAQRLLRGFRAAADASGKRICWVAGADLAHLGPFFGDDESVDDALLRRLHDDEHARLRCLQQARPGAFHTAVVANGNPDRICSATSMFTVGALAGRSGELLHYGQARAVDDSQVVSFCAMAF
jgi:AmmeMemoRadiSam system protein B